MDRGGRAGESCLPIKKFYSRFPVAESRERMIAKMLNLEVMDFKSGTWYVFPWGQMVKSGELLEELKSPEGQFLVSSRVRELAGAVVRMWWFKNSVRLELIWHETKDEEFIAETEAEAWEKALIWLGERMEKCALKSISPVKP